MSPKLSCEHIANLSSAYDFTQSFITLNLKITPSPTARKITKTL